MRFARPVLTFLLLVAMLPWGAYAGSHGAALPDADFLASVASDGTAAADLEQATQVVLAAKRCRGPALPGASCGPDVGLPGTSALVQPTRTALSLWPAAPPLLVGPGPEGLLDPPRSC